MFLDIEQQAMNSRSVNFEKKEKRQVKTMSVLAFFSCGTYWIPALGPTVTLGRGDNDQNLKRLGQLKFMGQNTTKRELVQKEFQKSTFQESCDS